jgi:transposase
MATHVKDAQRLSNAPRQLGWLIRPFWPPQTWAGKFLDEWCRQTMRSRIGPMKKIARSLRQHRELILNYFRAQKMISSGVVEGLNNKAKVTLRKSYGFRTCRVLELSLYHSPGKLPEAECTHDFFLRSLTSLDLVAMRGRAAGPSPRLPRT